MIYSTSKKNIKNIKKENKKALKKKVLNTSLRLEMKNERMITSIKGRLLHHIIECITPIK